MSPLQTYLDRYFLTKTAFAATAGVTPARLDALLALQAVPAPTYTCNGSTFHSAAFGPTDTTDAATGEYFRVDCTGWVQLADSAAQGQERATVIAALAAELDASLTAHLPDPALRQARIEAWLPYFFDGTFGLCVADPATGAGIARKEVLQDTLVSLTANGSDPAPAGITPAALLQLIDDYAAAAMPFSPAEYARSSRKRLVEDLKPRVAAGVADIPTLAAK